MRSEQEIFNELSSLCASPGYIHAFAALRFRDTIVGFAGEMKAQDMANLYSPSSLIRTELTTIMGLIIKKTIDFSIPKQNIISDYIDKTDRLMLEMHQAIGQLGLNRLQENYGNAKSNPFTFGDTLREAIFYSAESAYSFQYRDLAPAKYSADQEWLINHRGFGIDSASTVAKAITDVLHRRLPEKLKNLRYQPVDQWTMLPGFIFSSKEIAFSTSLPIILVEKILAAFSGPISGCNGRFTSLSIFNEAYAYPLIRLHNDEYALFQQYGIAEALYDTPFYWMMADEQYAATSTINRDNFTENFSYERLLSVFGPERVFKNVEIIPRKGLTLGEIDVLVLFGDQAILVQAKSKKLTLKARNGNDLCIQDDFRLAVQDAIFQAFDNADLLGNSAVILKCRDGRVVDLPARPKTIYPVAIIAEHYPALAFQTRQFVKFEATEQVVAPLVIDVFALDTITEMLNSPLRLVSYLRLRAKFGESYMMSHEHTLLSYHLKRNLWQSDFDLMLVGDDISADLDIAMAARRDNVPGASTPPGILTAFVDTPYAQIIAQIEDQADPVAIAVGFLLLELSGETIKALNRYVKRIFGLFAKDGGLHDATIGLGQSYSGLTIHCSQLLYQEANKRLLSHCKNRKYLQKANSWYGLALDANGSIKLAAVLVGPWVFDPEMEVTLATKPIRKGSVGRKTTNIGRNDPCPCGSGKKFKKCHGAVL